ncbi:MAG: bifunctional 5,10-methylenetetrahydrofolate dehydrogenase/5,10-methenyltetrahydrofolate cyclohydrolase [Christensenellales bacterium]
MKNISLDGKLFSKEIFEDLKIKFEKKSITQKLAIVLVGNNPESITYCNLKEKKCKEINLPCKIFHFNEDISQENLEIEINKIANDSTFVGMMIQHPIPKHLNEQNCFNLIPVEKDVDGLSNNSLGLLAQGKELFLPATVLGIIKLLEKYNIDVVSKKILIIGKSQIIGKPLALKLLNMGATVTVAHSKTKNLNKMIKNYEIVCVAIGKPEFFKAKYFRKGQIIIDAGYNKGNIGDVDQSAYKKASFFAPVPGGVGPMTVASLLYQTSIAIDKINKNNYK